MKIYFNHLSSIASETSSLFKERLLPSLTDQQKKILLIASVVFSLLAATCYVIISRIRFKAKPLQEEENKVKLFLELKEEDAGKEIRVPIGKPFSIQLWHSATTGHSSWEISQIPSFINKLDHYEKSLDDNEKSLDDSSRICGSGDDYVFVFEPKESGKGDIIMRQPSLDKNRIEEKKFTIIAE